MQSIATDSPIATAPVAVLECRPGEFLTKRFTADGKRLDFTAGYHTRIHDVPIAAWDDLLELLTLLVDCPRLCVVRGAAAEDCPRAGDAEFDEWVYRRKHSKPGEPANFVSVARQWVVYDFDDTAEPLDLRDPEISIRAWHSKLPHELRAAQSAFFPSASAHVSPTVRGKLVVWYRRPVSEAQARAFAVHYSADPSVAVCVQPNYFAAPIFEGCADPLAGKRQPVVFEGKPAAQPSPEALKATRSRPAPVILADLPPGDAGIVAALGPQERLVGLRFAVVGQLGGVMRKLGFPRGACAAIVSEWLPRADLAPRLKWALGAWDCPSEEVSGYNGLASLVGEAHAKVIVDACMRARRSKRIVLPGRIER